MENKIVAEVEKEYECSLVDITTELESFIFMQSSEVTGKNYYRWITEYISWAKGKSINPVGITRVEVESYELYLLSINSPNSVRCKLLGISSFYTFLRNRNPKVLLLNPFNKLKLPKEKKTRKIDVITSDDIYLLREEFTRIGRKDIVCAIDMMCKYGYRVGLFECMKVDPRGNWTSDGKDEIVTSGKFTKKETEEITTCGLLGMKGYTITNIFKKYTNKLYESGKIGSSFSPHDIRHWYITINGKGKTMEEFIKFSRGIHKSIYTTLGYMNI